MVLASRASLAAVMGAGARRVGLAPEAAADTPAWLVGSAAPRQVSESFFGPNRSVRRIPDRVRRPARRQQLWAVSERLTAPWLAGMPTDAERAGAVAQWPRTIATGSRRLRVEVLANTDLRWS